MTRIHVVWAQRRDAQILKLWNAGHSSHIEIATEVGLTPNTVGTRLRYLKSLNCPMRHPEYSKVAEYDETIKEMFLAGAPSKDIGKAIQLSPQTVSARIRFLRAMRELPAGRPVLPSETEEEVIALRKDGIPYRIIAKKLDITVGTVAGVISRARRKGETFKLLKAAPGKTKNISSGVLRMEKTLGVQMPRRKSPGGPRKLPLTPPPKNSHPVLFVETTARQCKWPLWGMEDRTRYCCGATTVPARSYCKYHFERAYK